MRTSASGPLVIHIFVPLAIQRSPLRSALHAMEPTTSEPAPGSLIASAPTNAPEQSFGRYLRRCDSLPLRYRLFTHRLECAPYERPTDAEARETSSIATTCATYPRPVPPYSSGTVIPSRPSSPSFLHMSAGNRSEEHTSELQSRLHLVCRLLLEKKKKPAASTSRYRRLARPCARHASRFTPPSPARRWPRRLSPAHARCSCPAALARPA